MSKIKLTAGRIRDLKVPPCKQQALIWDTEAPGLGVRVTSGSKSFVFQCKLAGKDLRITIGDVLSWPIDSTDPEAPGARQEARRLRTLVDQGIDPRVHRAEKIAKVVAQQAVEDSKATTFGAAWQAYVADRSPMWSEAHKRGHEQAVHGKKINGPLHDLLEVKLIDLGKDRIKQWLDDNVSERPTFTANCFRKLRACLNWCLERDEFRHLIQPDACGRSVARDRVPKTKARTDCLQREQLAPWFAEVCKLSNPTISAYLQILLLTGARREEMASLKWDHVDLRWRSLTIADKVEGERIIPMTPYVASLLCQLKASNETPPPKYRILHGKKIENDLKNWRPSEWVFSSKTAESGRMVEPRIALNRAVAAAGLPPLTLHGLRRSFGTLAEWVECPVGISAQIMGHKPSAVAEKHYRQRPLDLLRMWHTKIEAWILAEAGIEQPKEEPAGLKAVTAA